LAWRYDIKGSKKEINKMKLILPQADNFERLAQIKILHKNKSKLFKDAIYPYGQILKDGSCLAHGTHLLKNEFRELSKREQI